MPVIVVLTKAFSKRKGREFKSIIEEKNINIVSVIPVLASPYEFEFDDEIKIMKPYGLENLIELTMQVIPKSAQDALINAQCVDIELKKKKAQTIVTATTATNFGAGFVPLPFADSAVLVTTQTAMIASITAVFGIPMEKALLTAIVSAVAGCSGATILGKTIVANLLKCIPGIGTMAGGAISAATASALTVALGEAYIKLMGKIAKGEFKKDEMTQAEIIENMKSYFKAELKKEKS